MADLGKSLKGAWMKGMEAIGNTASSIASNTRYKVNEMNLINRRREILSDFGARAYELWQKGAQFPDELDAQLKELSNLDEQLNAIRTERLAGVTTAENASDTPSTDEAAPTIDVNAQEGSSVPTIDVDAPAEEKPDDKTLEDAIDHLVHQVDDGIEQIADAVPAAQIEAKVNSAIETVHDTMSQVSDALGASIQSMADALNDTRDDESKPQ